MAITNGYVSLAEFRTYVRELSDMTSDDAEFEAVITSASRAVDAYCGRRFYLDVSASARLFRPVNAGLVLVDDIASTDDLLIKTDPAGTGMFSETWSSGDYELRPVNGVVGGLSGWPYTQVAAVGSRGLPCTSRASVQVTAVWGWAAVPEPVKLGTKMLALEHYRQRDVPFGVMGMGDFATRIRANPQVQMLLNDYRTARHAAPAA